MGQILCIFSTYCPPFYTFFYLFSKMDLYIHFVSSARMGQNVYIIPILLRARRRGRGLDSNRSWSWSSPWSGRVVGVGEERKRLARVSSQLPCEDDGLLLVFVRRLVPRKRRFWRRLGVRGAFFRRLLRWSLLLLQLAVSSLRAHGAGPER